MLFNLQSGLGRWFCFGKHPSLSGHINHLFGKKHVLVFLSGIFFPSARIAADFPPAGYLCRVILRRAAYHTKFLPKACGRRIVCYCAWLILRGLSR